MKSWSPLRVRDVPFRSILMSVRWKEWGLGLSTLYLSNPPIDSENQSSQAKAAPQANAASKSSDPASVVAAVVKIASETYMATMDSLSMRERRLENLSTFRATTPTMMPMMMPNRI